MIGKYSSGPKREDYRICRHYYVNEFGKEDKTREYFTVEKYGRQFWRWKWREELKKITSSDGIIEWDDLHFKTWNDAYGYIEAVTERKLEPSTWYKEITNKGGILI